jgi:hypothetical protein
MAMYSRINIVLFGLLAVLAGLPRVSSAQTCSQTLNAGADVASAISSAAAGSTICLNSGSYGQVTVSGITKSSTVTIRSATGTGASLSGFSIAGVSHLTFSSLQLPGGLDIDSSGGASNNLSILNSQFAGSQLIVNTTGNTNANILIDGNTFGGYNSTGFEGTITVWRNPPTGNNNGVTISHNTFNGAGCGDGINVTGGANGITVGPGNTFQNYQQNSCSVHVDSFQLVDGSNITITGNYFTKDTIFLGIYDGGSNLTVTNNVFNTGDSGVQNFQIGGVTGMTFTHNTIKNSTMAIGTKTGDTPNNQWTVQNNIYDNSPLIDAGDQPGCNTNCTFSFNMFQSGARGTSNVIGSPTYVGGTTPATWAGWQLQSGSLGKSAGSDSADLGTNFYGGTASAPTPPTNLRIVAP